jgi:nitroimidazol reductase NimA-like FMN-containing flavoprotein (pyridoxamine 5'-phosphate oxidase superfamily)
MTEQLARHRKRRRVQVGDATDGFERLDEATCWALLADAAVGRVGVVVGGAAEIYPVNYVVDRQPDGAPAIVFRTDPGTKLAGLARTPHISFEVDDLDLDEHVGWSVVVKGRARQIRELADPEERRRTQQLPVANWDPAPKRHWIRLEPTEVTGRRIGRRPAGRPRLEGLPSVADWTGRDVWVPPALTGLRQ